MAQWHQQQPAEDEEKNNPAADPKGQWRVITTAIIVRNVSMECEATNLSCAIYIVNIFVFKCYPISSEQ